MSYLHLFPVLSELTPESFDFDYASRVPVSSIISIVIGLILAVAVPILLFVYVKHRFRLEPAVALYSLLAYMLGGYLIPNLVIMLCEYIDTKNGMFSSNPILYYALISIFSATILLLSIWFSIRLLKRRCSLTLGSSILFTLCLIIVPLCTQTISILGSYLSAGTSINQGNLPDIISNMIEQGSTRDEIQTLLDAVDSLCTTGFWYYLIVAIDSLLQIPIQLPVCAILAGKQEGKVPSSHVKLAFAVEGLYAIAMILRRAAMNESVIIAELPLVAAAVISVLIAWKVVKQYLADDLKKLLGKPNPAVNKKDDGKGNGNGGHKMPKIVMPKD